MMRLALAFLAESRLSTMLNILLLAIPVAMLVLLLQFTRQSEERFLSGAEGIDLVVGATGSPLQLILSSVYHLDRPIGNIPLAQLERLRRNPMVGSAIPLALGDQFNGFRIVGSEPALLDLYQAELQQGRIFEAPLEVVIGAEVAQATSAQIGQRFIGNHGLAEEDGTAGHSATPFEVVGILEPTAKPIDRLIITSVESVWDVHGIAHGNEVSDAHHNEDEEDHTHEDHASEPEISPEITAILLRYRTPAAAVRLPPTINQNSELQAASPARESTRLIMLFGPAIQGVGAFAILLALAGALAIFISLWSAMRGREPDLALLRVMGASRGTIFRTVLMEGLVCAALAAITGVGLAHAALWFGANHWPVMASAGISAGQVGLGEALIFTGTIAIGALAALHPALRVTRSHLGPILQRN